MRVKALELRDDGTLIPVLAMKMEAASTAERWLFWRAGYPADGSAVVLMDLNTHRASVDPYSWASRTFAVGHQYVYERFDQLREGDVVDVEFLLGETPTPKSPSSVPTIEA